MILLQRKKRQWHGSICKRALFSMPYLSQFSRLSFLNVSLCKLFFPYIVVFISTQYRSFRFVDRAVRGLIKQNICAICNPMRVRSFYSAWRFTTSYVSSQPFHLDGDMDKSDFTFSKIKNVVLQSTLMKIFSISLNQINEEKDKRKRNKMSQTRAFRQ